MLRPMMPKWYERDTSGMRHSRPFLCSGILIHISQSQSCNADRRSLKTAVEKSLNRYAAARVRMLTH